MARQADTGFTLMELLVVITIVALLASMLMAGIKQVRVAAKNSKCGSNQRSINIAMQTYCTDNEGLLPYRIQYSEWWDRMSGYLENQYLDSYQKNRNDVFHCPFADREIPNPNTFSSRFMVHFGMNSHIRACSDTTGTSWTLGQTPIPVASLPANLVITTDNKVLTSAGLNYFEGAVDYGVTSGPWPVNMGATGGTKGPIRWHGNSINLLCVDGHVERISGTWDEAFVGSRFRTKASKL